jgi:DNA-binding NarL/FixJ family response regulator
VTDSSQIFQIVEGRLSHAVGSDRHSGGSGEPSDGSDQADSDLIARAIAADEESSSEIDLSRPWRELVQGSATVVGSFFTATRCGLVLAATERSETQRLSGRRLEIIEAVLSGIGQNCVAIDMKLAPSTVALNARQALESLGIVGRPSRVHPLVMLAATAGRERALVAGSLSFVPSAKGELQVIGIPRPDRRLAEILPSAEVAVIAKLVEGCCYAEIAKSRRTAERTIANQIAAVFRRLNVSGRSELIQRLFRLDGLISRRPAPTTVPPPPTVREPLSLVRTPRNLEAVRRYAPPMPLNTTMSAAAK